VAEDEDGHYQQQNGGVGPLLAAAFFGMYNNPEVEKSEEDEGDNTKD